jgi:hypothetical protein
MLIRCQYFSTPAAQAAPEFLAQGYFYHNSTYLPVPFMDLSIVTGAGSVISNVLDYTKWIRALLTQPSSGPISASGYRALLTSRSILEKALTVHGPTNLFIGMVHGHVSGIRVLYA